MSGFELRTKRAAARIDGQTVVLRMGGRMYRSRLSDIERGRVNAKPGEIEGISDAIDSIIAERSKIAALAAEHGLTLAGVGL
jgi:hypothetical protein